MIVGIVLDTYKIIFNWNMELTLYYSFTLKSKALNIYAWIFREIITTNFNKNDTII